MARANVHAPPPLQSALQLMIQCLAKERVPYFLLGGLAIAVLGEPRLTYDIDFDIRIAKTAVPKLLRRFVTAGIHVAMEQSLDDVQRIGTFRMRHAEVQIDCIVASTALELSAFRRRKRHRLFDCQVYLPSVEDLLLLKLIPGRPKDLQDAEGLVVRHRTALDRSYLKKWAQRVCDAAEDFRLWHQLQKLLE